MFCVDSMTGSVSAVPERNLKELWDKDVSTQTSGWVLETLENLETSALNKGFFIAFNSIDLLPLSASTFPIYSHFYLQVDLIVLLQHKFSVSVSLKHDYLWCYSIVHWILRHSGIFIFMF